MAIDREPPVQDYQTIFGDIPVFKSGDQIKKKAEARINLAQIDPQQSLSPEQLSELELLIRTITPEFRYKLTMFQAWFLGF